MKTRAERRAQKLKAKQAKREAARARLAATVTAVSASDAPVESDAILLKGAFRFKAGSVEVKAAFDNSGFSTSEWNALKATERLAYIRAVYPQD